VVLGLAMLVVTAGASIAADSPRTKIPFIGKSPDHGYGSRTYMHASGMLATCAERAANVDAVVMDGRRTPRGSTA
jgi:hypothetical protein